MIDQHMRHELLKLWFVFGKFWGKRGNFNVYSYEIVFVRLLYWYIYINSNKIIIVLYGMLKLYYIGMYYCPL